MVSKCPVLLLYLGILTLIFYDHEKLEASKIDKSVLASNSSNKVYPSSIIGGKETEPGEFKFIVTIDTTMTTGAGVTLKPNWIITGRHMIVSINKAKKVEFVRQRLKIYPKYTNNQGENRKRKHFEPEKLFCHPLPEKREFWWNSDIALIKLSESIAFGPPEDLKGIEIASNSDSEQKDLPIRIAGWGKTDHRSDSGSRYLMAINTTRNPESECGETYNNLIFPQIFCAGVDGKTVCQGDSGGPVITKSKRTGKEVLVGTVMGGPADCSDMGLFVNVSYYKPWIEKVMETEDPKFECSSIKPDK
ncbi:venom peptide isomerase heavy chain-like [Brevipalpus obovatus]|uniref:venom peptide isomerase heavy chain-like n=1 Tax=Brevipalpus obovatus TaxID=246614 RepID=UPI003D9DCF04